MLSSEGGSFALREGVNQVGRDLNSDIVLLNTTIARSHAEIIIAGSAVHVRDLGALHGVFINCVRIRPDERVPLHAGDRVALGKVAMQLRKQGDATKTD